MKNKTNEFIEIEHCIKYKCKVCPRQVECEERQKQYRLLYRPFENLNEILEKKLNGNTTR